MKGKEFVAELHRKFDTSTDFELKKLLGTSQLTLINWRKRDNITPRIVADQFKRFLSQKIPGADLVDALKNQFGAATLKELARGLGISTVWLNNWSKRSHITAKQIASLIENAALASEKKLQVSAVRPLAEFFRIEKCKRGKGNTYDLFDDKDNNSKPHPYLSGLRKELERENGVYIFFDSQGKSIYAGKAKRQSLWKEMNLAFNRARGDVQSIRRVSHPSRKQPYKTTEEKSRQIKIQAVPLNQLAAYFSAYYVNHGMIEEVESLLVRSFANDLLNKRMEKFSASRKKAAKKPPQKSSIAKPIRKKT